MARNHGITADTYKKFIVDAGEVYAGWTDFGTPGTLLGATRGGSSLTVEQEIREMEVDGARGPVKGGRRITMVKATLTVNIIEHTAANFKRALAGADVADFGTPANWDAVTRSLDIQDADYLNNICIVGEVSGSANGVAIKLDNALADGNFELSFADKDEGVLSTTFTAHFDPANLGADNDIEPWTIYMPKPV